MVSGAMKIKKLTYAIKGCKTTVDIKIKIEICW